MEKHIGKAAPQEKKREGPKNKRNMRHFVWPDNARRLHIVPCGRVGASLAIPC